MIFEVIFVLAAGAIWYVIGYAAGHARGQGKRALTPKDPKPVCGCGHHYALHSEDGSCGQTETTRTLVERGSPSTLGTGYQGQDYRVVYSREKYEAVSRPCSCKRYTGPEPMPRYLP